MKQWWQLDVKEILGFLSFDLGKFKGSDTLLASDNPKQNLLICFCFSTITYFFLNLNLLLKKVSDPIVFGTRFAL